MRKKQEGKRAILEEALRETEKLWRLSVNAPLQVTDRIVTESQVARVQPYLRRHAAQVSRVLATASKVALRLGEPATDPNALRHRIAVAAGLVRTRVVLFFTRRCARRNDDAAVSDLFRGIECLEEVRDTIASILRAVDGRDKPFDLMDPWWKGTPEEFIFMALKKRRGTLTAQQIAASKGDTTVPPDLKKKLALLVRARHLTQSREKGGYGLPEWERPEDTLGAY